MQCVLYSLANYFPMKVALSKSESHLEYNVALVFLLQRCSEYCMSLCIYLCVLDICVHIIFTCDGSCAFGA